MAALVVVTTALVARKLTLPRAPHLDSSGATAPPRSSLVASAPAFANGGTEEPHAWAASPALFDASVPALPASTFHGDAERRNRAHGRGPRGEPRVAFSVQLGAPIASQAVISKDGAFIYVATLGGKLVALSLDGATKWTFDLGDRAYGSPAVADDGTIYVGSDKKALFAISPNGEQRWRLEVAGEADVAPLITPAGMIVIAAGDTVYGVRASGDVAARFRARRKVYSAPSLAPEGKIAFGSQDHMLYVVDGGLSLVRAIDLGADVDCAPAGLDDGSFVVGTDRGEVVKIDRDGAIVFRTDVAGYVRGGITVTRSGDIVVGTFGPVPRVVRLSATGQTLGAVSLQGSGAKDFGIWGSPLEDDALGLYFGAEDDRVRGLDAFGNQIFSYTTGGDVDAPVTMLSDGSLLVGSEDGTLSRLLP